MRLRPAYKHGFYDGAVTAVFFMIVIGGLCAAIF